MRGDFDARSDGGFRTREVGSSGHLLQRLWLLPEERGQAQASDRVTALSRLLLTACDLCGLYLQDDERSSQNAETGVPGVGKSDDGGGKGSHRHDVYVKCQVQLNTFFPPLFTFNKFSNYCDAITSASQFG